MAHRYNVLHDLDLVYIQLYDDVDGPECRAISRDLLADDDIQEDYDLLWDCRYISELVIDLEDVHDMVDMKAGVLEGDDLIVALRSIDTGVAKLFTVLARMQDIDSSLYHSVSAALDHLDVPPEQVPDTLLTPAFE